MEKLYNTKFLVILNIVMVSILLVGVVIGGYKINDKLNNINSKIKKINDLINSKQLGESKPTNERVPSNTKTIEYDFESKVSESIDKYLPTGNYLIWEGMVTKQENKDSDGVLLVFREEIDGDSYHPVAIAQYGLSMYRSYIKTKDESYLEKAKKQADYFVNNIDKKTGQFFYDFDFHIGETNETLEKPWASAMAQGQACSLLARMYYATGDEKYLKTIKLAIEPLQVGVDDGGLRQDFFGHPWYVEYPTNSPIFVLNGFIFTLFGLYEVWQIAEDETAYELYKDGVNTLVFALPFYDANGISFYHLANLFGENLKPYYNAEYHKIHVLQLQTINQWEKNKVIDFYIKQWISYVN